MPIFDKLAALFAGPSPESETSEAARDKQRFFEALVRQAKPWSTDEWRESWKAYEGDAKRPPRANLWRVKVDTQAAYLDEQPPSLPVKPTDGFADDEQAKGRAEAEEAVYAYLYREMGFRQTIAQARHTADVTNVAAVVHCVDMRRMLPDLKAIPVDHVAVDPDCQGDLRAANWLGWWEYIAPETLVADNPDLSLERLRELGEDSAADLQPDDRLRLKSGLDQVRRVRKRVRLWRLFLRNEYALYDAEPGTEPDGEPHWERFRDRHGMREPRRYVVFIEKFDDHVLEDQDRWPDTYALDWDDWPVHLLTWNRGEEDLEGFSDYRHERVVLQYHDDAVHNLKVRAALANNTKIGKFVGCAIPDATIRAVLERQGLEIMPEAFTQDGRPTIGPIRFDQVTEPDLSVPQAFRDLHEQIAGIPRIKQGGESDYKTATEAQIASESATALSNMRLRVFEEFQAAIATQTIAMAHVLCPQVSEVEIIAPAPDATGALVPMPTLQRVPAPLLAQVLAQEGAELVRLGVDAMVGSQKAAYWDENLSPEMLRRSTQVAVEHGSTQRRMRLQKVELFAEVYERQIAPMLSTLGQLDPLAALEKHSEALRKVLALLDLGEFESLMPDIDAMAAQRMAQQQAEAAAASGMGGPVPMEEPVAQV